MKGIGNTYFDARYYTDDIMMPAGAGGRQPTITAMFFCPFRPKTGQKRAIM